MKKLLFGVVFILIGIAVAYTMLIVPARRLTYPDNSKLTKYPGNTQMTRQVSEHVIVNPKGEGMPLEVSQSEKYKYSPDAYELYDIPQQTNLIYSVGSFEKWVYI